MKEEYNGDAKKGCIYVLISLMISAVVFMITYFVGFIVIITAMIYTLKLVQYIAPDFYIWAIDSYKNLLMIK